METGLTPRACTVFCSQSVLHLITNELTNPVATKGMEQEPNSKIIKSAVQEILPVLEFWAVQSGVLSAQPMLSFAFTSLVLGLQVYPTPFMWQQA